MTASLRGTRARGVPLPGWEKQRPYVATTGQVWALYDAVPEGVRPAILLGAHAGLRLAEAAALRVEDVDLVNGVVAPSTQWLDEPLKSDTSRTSIPIPKEMAHLLAEAIQLGDDLCLTGMTPHARRSRLSIASELQMARTASDEVLAGDRRNRPRVHHWPPQRSPVQGAHFAH